MKDKDNRQNELFEGESQPTKPLSRVERRLVKSSALIQIEGTTDLLFQHSVFCQTSLPYRSPQDAIVWERIQGRAALRVRAGEAFDEETGEWVQLGLPYGPKPRLILAYLNTEALRTQSADIEVEQSLTAFVERVGLSKDGRTIRTVKDQLGRLAASEIRLAVSGDGDTRGRQVNAHIVSGFDLWFPKDDRQRVLWPSVVRLSGDYFESLQRHAVPLDERAIAALSHSAMALDIYSWLTQRLHRIHPSCPQFVPWTALKDQFGWHYSRMRKFREVFLQTLDMVVSQYPDANVETDGRGLTLRNSKPPVPPRSILLPKA